MATKIVRVWPVGYSSDAPVDYGRGASFTVHPDGDLTIERRSRSRTHPNQFAVWARGEWSHVEYIDKPVGGAE